VKSLRRAVFNRRLTMLGESVARYPDRMVGGVVEAILPCFPELEAGERAAVRRDAAAFVTSQIRAMPSVLRLPVVLAVLVLDALPLVRYGRRFRGLDRARQEAALARWSANPLGPLRDVLKLLRSLALLAYFDHPLVAARLGRTEPASCARVRAAQ